MDRKRTFSSDKQKEEKATQRNKCTKATLRCVGQGPRAGLAILWRETVGRACLVEETWATKVARDLVFFGGVKRLASFHQLPF